MIFGGGDEKVLYSYAISFCGVPYRWGGDDPMAGYDCCLVGSSKVLSETGLKSIKDIRPGESVYSYKEGKLEIQTVLALHENGVKPVYKVKIAGTTLHCTDNHRFLVVNTPKELQGWSRRKGRSLEWRELRDINKGDVVLSYTGFRGSSAEYSLNQIKFFGALLGDGTTHSDEGGVNLCFLSEKKRAHLDEYFQIAVDDFGFKNKRCFSETHGLMFNSVDFLRKLQEMGFRGKSVDRVLPSWVFRSSPEQFDAFLEGYFLADGHKYSREGKESGYSISSASKALIDDLHLQCFIRGYNVSNITVNNRMKPIFIKGLEVDNARPLYSFTIYDSTKRSFPCRGAGPKPYHDFSVSESFSFQRVRVIERLPVDLPTYDLTVEDSHSYIAEGFVVHNSGLVQEILASVGLDPRGDQTAQKLHDYFEKEATMSAFPDFGALAFYGSSTKRISHVGFCLNRNLMLEAGGGGSRTHDLEDAKAQNAYVRIRPVDQRSDLVSVLMPGYTWLN